MGLFDRLKPGSGHTAAHGTPAMATRGKRTLSEATHGSQPPPSSSGASDTANEPTAAEADEHKTDPKSVLDAMARRQSEIMESAAFRDLVAAGKYKAANKL